MNIITWEAQSPLGAKAAGAPAAETTAGATGAPSSAQFSVTATLASTSLPQPSAPPEASAAANSFGGGAGSSLAACSSFSA